MAYNDFFKTDERGRTTLFYAAEIGDIEAVKAIIYKLVGTGMSCQRLALINKKDLEGLTAIDVAAKAGNSEITELLQSEKMRMEFFE
jgi:ankyrin repeat protein